jgi:hypothetical protein
MIYNTITRDNFAYMVSRQYAHNPNINNQTIKWISQLYLSFIIVRCSVFAFHKLTKKVIITIGKMKTILYINK